MLKEQCRGTEAPYRYMLRELLCVLRRDGENWSYSSYVIV